MASIISLFMCRPLGENFISGWGGSEGRLSSQIYRWVNNEMKALCAMKIKGIHFPTDKE
jgi:hypothetical protein